MDKNTLRSAMKEIILSALRNGITDKDSLSKIKNNVCQKYGINTFPDAELLSVYRQMIESGEVQRSDAIERLLQKRGIRTLSGISPVSVLMPRRRVKVRACIVLPSGRMHRERHFFSSILKKNMASKKSEKVPKTRCTRYAKKLYQQRARSYACAACRIRSAHPDFTPTYRPEKNGTFPRKKRTHCSGGHFFGSPESHEDSVYHPLLSSV
jgi:hypothetical protein